MSNVFISYGFAEGDWNSRLLHEELREYDHTITTDISNADVVIAHSGGCFLVPAEKQYDLLLLVNTTYWPERSIFTRIRNKISKDTAHTCKQYGVVAWLNKTVRNIGYGLVHPGRARAMYIGMKGSSVPTVNARRIVVIRNRNDPWLSQSFHEVFTIPEATFISLPGEHDDIWENPERYVQLLKVAK